MAHFSDTINDGVDSQPVSEKLRCLGAIREMLRLARNYISNGLPQVGLAALSVSSYINRSADLSMLTIRHSK